MIFVFIFNKNIFYFFKNFIHIIFNYHYLPFKETDQGQLPPDLQLIT
jgi:hypothetical protein